MHTLTPSCQARHLHCCSPIALHCCHSYIHLSRLLGSYATEIQSIAKPPATLNGYRAISTAYAFVLVAYVTLTVSAFWVGASARWHLHVGIFNKQVW